MITEDLERPTTLEKSDMEKTVRKEVKSLFDSYPKNDMIYQIYNTIDKNISLELSQSDSNNDSTKNSILRIVEFFNILHFFESINDFVRDAYLNHHNLRHGFLTDGVLLKTEKRNDQTRFVLGYTISELTQIHLENPELYKSIIIEIEDQLKGDVLDSAEDKWYFWPGCEMKIPSRTKVLLDTSISKSKFVVTKRVEKLSDEATQIVLEEKPYQLEVSLLGDNEFFYKDCNDPNQNNHKLKPGFFAINKSEPEFEGVSSNDFSEIELALNNGEEYEYTLYMPYNSPRFDVKTNMKIFNKDQGVEEFVATTT
ncbi:hypothetical protein [Aquimarina sediminis]|uniref:hypothetical protein n=1 Tax=Aquimarina sediminis TaxID=2070536 RepID=UPI000CA062A1|nr:hypothetical protein [Aquimarina sediminis]